MGNSRRTGLTLVESLFAISALAILFIQAVPAAQRARSDARLVLCQQRMGGIARASLIYAGQDANDLVVPIAYRDSTSPRTIYSPIGFGGKSGTDAFYDPSLRTSRFSGEDGLDANQRPLNRILFKAAFPPPSGIPGYTVNWSRDGRLDLKEYHCPGDVEFPGMHHQGWKDRDSSSYNYYGTSYAANTLFTGTQVGQPLLSHSPYARGITQVPNPGKTILYFENAARFAMFAPNTVEFNQTGCFWNDGLYADAADQGMVARGHHGADWTFVTSFVDGRAAFVRMQGHGRVPRPPGMPASCGTASCDCILVRGIGWQRDTFPADFVATSKILGSGSGADIDTVVP
jgi:type II secretory pathway pseudopilin PulG